MILGGAADVSSHYKSYGGPREPHQGLFMALGAQRRDHLELVAQPLDPNAELVENQRRGVTAKFSAKTCGTMRSRPDQLRGDAAEHPVAADFLDRRPRQFRDQVPIALRREQSIQLRVLGLRSEERRVGKERRS